MGIEGLLKEGIIPYQHQHDAFDFLMGFDAAALFADPGTGKTLVGVAVAGERFRHKQVKRLLILCPLSVVDVWKQEFHKFAKFPFYAAVKAFPPDYQGNALEVLIINYDSAWRYDDAIIKWHPDMVIADESQRMKNQKSKASKFGYTLSKVAKYRLLMTGTPITQGCCDIYSQFKFMDPSIYGTNLKAFQSKYCIMSFDGFTVVGYKNEKDYAAKLHARAYRVTADECLDLPPIIDKKEYCYLQGNAKKAYKQMDEEYLAEVAAEHTVASPVMLVRLMRLQQIAGGFLKLDLAEDAKAPNLMPVGSEKLNLLKTIITQDYEPTKKLVIFARFSAEVAAIEALMRELGRKYITIQGSTQNRGELINAFQTDPKITVAVIQIQAGGVGITLTASDTVIYYSMTFSYADYEQSRARIRRIGQNSKSVTYIHLLAKDTIDEVVLKAVQKKQDLASYIIDELRAKKH
jgi:SNF2 family DNA or RNA helicase